MLQQFSQFTKFVLTGWMFLYVTTSTMRLSTVDSLRFTDKFCVVIARYSYRLGLTISYHMFRIQPIISERSVLSRLVLKYSLQENGTFNIISYFHHLFILPQVFASEGLSFIFYFEIKLLKER